MSVPRSAVLAAWAGAVLAGRSGLTDAVAAVVGDEEHDVVWGDVPPGGATMSDVVGHPVPDPAYLADLLALLSAAAEGASPRVRLAMPAPGDAVGVPPAPGLLGHACDVGECVVVEGLRGPDGREWHVAAVPDAESYGTRTEPGTRVTWCVRVSDRPAPPGALVPPAGLAEADMQLRLALRDVTRELERLEVAAWPGSEGAGVREEPFPPMPPSLGGRARAVLASGSRVLAIAEAAGTVPGGAVSGHELGRRAAALADIRRAARRAVEAAINLPG